MITTRTRALLFGLALCLAAAGAALFWRSSTATAPTPAPAAKALVATVRSDPRSLNRLIIRDRTSHLVSVLTHARLVRVNLATQDIEPALAERWDLAPDGRSYTLHLRKGVSFSDGAPFSARDVAFTFRALFDPKVESPLASLLLVGGVAPTLTVVDDHTVTLVFPSPFSPALRTLDAVPILPAHKLATALEQGTFKDAWTVTTPPAELAGLGPFVLREYVPSQRLEFERNPHYWQRDEQGGVLPRLDRLTLQVVPDQNGEMLRLESGEADLVSGEARPEDIASLKAAAARGQLQLVEAGTGLDPDMFWFNLRPEAGREPARAWLTRPELRRAISLAVDRQAFVEVVYLGAGTPIDGPVTPGNRRWYDAGRPAPVHDLAQAGRLLDDLGLVDRDGDGQRETSDGKPARFSLLTSKGSAVRERGAAFLQQQIANIGLGVDVVPLEVGAFIDHLTKGTFEAAWFVCAVPRHGPGQPPRLLAQLGQLPRVEP